MAAADEPHPDVRSVLDQVATFDVTPLADHGPEGARDLFATDRPNVEGQAVGEVLD